MVRVLGSSGDSEFRRESLREDAHIKVETEMAVSTEVGLLSTRDNEKVSTDCRSFGRDSYEKKMKEEDLAIDLEDKPRLLPQVPSGTLVDHTLQYDPPDENPMGKSEEFSSKTNPTKAKWKKIEEAKVHPG